MTLFLLQVKERKLQLWVFLLGFFGHIQVTKRTFKGTLGNEFG